MRLMKFMTKQLNGLQIKLLFLIEKDYIRLVEETKEWIQQAYIKVSNKEK